MHTVLAGNHYCYYFLGTRGQRLPVGWSRRGSNPGPSDSQPDHMEICHGDPLPSTPGKVAKSRMITSQVSKLVGKDHIFQYLLAISFKSLDREPKVCPFMKDPQG